jgi:hypothetical protein
MGAGRVTDAPHSRQVIVASNSLHYLGPAKALSTFMKFPRFEGLSLT